MSEGVYRVNESVGVSNNVGVSEGEGQCLWGCDCLLVWPNVVQGVLLTLLGTSVSVGYVRVCAR